MYSLLFHGSFVKLGQYYLIQEAEGLSKVISCGPAEYMIHSGDGMTALRIVWGE